MTVNYGFLFSVLPIFNIHIRKVSGRLQTCLNHFNCDYSKMDLDLLAHIDEMYAFIEAINTWNLWLRMGIAQSAFVASLCLKGRTSGESAFEFRAVASMK